MILNFNRNYQIWKFSQEHFISYLLKYCNLPIIKNKQQFVTSILTEEPIWCFSSACANCASFQLLFIEDEERDVEMAKGLDWLLILMIKKTFSYNLAIIKNIWKYCYAGT